MQKDADKPLPERDFNALKDLLGEDNAVYVQDYFGLMDQYKLVNIITGILSKSALQRVAKKFKQENSND